MGSTGLFKSLAGFACVTALITACAGMEPTPEVGYNQAPSAAPLTRRTALTMGHCFVRPVAFDGDKWGLLRVRQFGWGGEQPPSWKGSGTITRLDDTHARYEDDGGTTWLLRPADHPKVTLEGEVCA
jgi:hypothetical protein